MYCILSWNQGPSSSELGGIAWISGYRTLTRILCLVTPTEIYKIHVHGDGQLFILKKAKKFTLW